MFVVKTFETGLEVNHPKGKPLPIRTELNQTIAFVIDSHDRLFFGGRYVDVWSAEAIIKQRSTENPKALVVMQLQQGAHLKTMVRLYDLTLSVGVPRGQIAVLTKI